MAAILFMDVVGFSKRSDNDCLEIMQDLNDYVAYWLREDLRKHCLVPASPTVVTLPTGDGMAVCFLERDNTPRGHRALRTAIEIHRWASKRKRSFHLRFGIHTGTLWEVQDVNGQVNVCGDAINIAQRIMDCGEEDHILCSEEAYRAYYQRPDEGSPSDFKNLDFKELRGYVGKHLVSLHLRNISGKDDEGGEVGNPSPPQPRWELELEASPGEVTKFLLQHLSAKSLAFVGITNEQKVSHINSTLRKESRNAEHSSADQKPAWERLEFFFLKPDLYNLVVEDRDTPARKQGLRQALETLQGLCQERLLRQPSNRSPGDTAVIEEKKEEKVIPELVCRWYECFPYVGLSAVDPDRENGVIRFSPHFWGKRVEEIPGFVLRWVSERPSRLYGLYRDTLDHLRTESSKEFLLEKALEDLARDPEAGRAGTQEAVAPH